MSIYYNLPKINFFISTLSKQPSPTKTRHPPLIFHVQTPIINHVSLQIDGETEERDMSLINFLLRAPLLLPRPQSLCMYAKSRNCIRPPSYTPPSRFSLPFPLPLFFFFSFHGPPLGRPARNTPGGFVTGGWPVLRPGRACANVLRLRYHATSTASKIEIPFPLILHGIELCGGDTGPRNGISL